MAEEILSLRAERDAVQEERQQAQVAQSAAGQSAQLEEELKRQAERLYVISKHEEERREIEGMRVREYLMRYMVPNLTEGLIEICKVMPDNPVDYLANYLEKHAAVDHSQR